MWIFTKYGFYSAVCSRQGDGKHNQPVDPNRIMVRTRLREHLENLKKQFPDLLSESDIKEFTGTDYAFRIFVAKADWSKVLVGLNEDVDYDNFKSEVAKYQGPNLNAYQQALHDVWSVMNRLQK